MVFAMAKRLDENGVLYLLSKLLLMFVRSEPGKGLSQREQSGAHHEFRD
jgi:hypothetical protein